MADSAQNWSRRIPSVSSTRVEEALSESVDVKPSTQVLADDPRTVILDVRVPSIPVAELGAHQVPGGVRH